MSPIAVFAQSDQARAQAVVQSLGGIQAVSVPIASLAQPVQSLAALQAQLGNANPIVFLVGSVSGTSTLFQSIALFAQQQSKRLLIIDLDNAGLANVSGSIKQLGDSVIAASDPKLPEVLDTPDRWTLPDGSPYPETGIKHQKKC